MPWLKLPRSNRPTKMAHRTSKHMGVQEKERSPIWSYQIWRNQRNISQEKNKAWWYLWCLCGMFVSVCQSSSMISYSRFMYVPCIYTNLPFNHPKMSSIWVFERSSKPSPTHVQNSTPLFPGGVSMADWHHQPWPTRFTTICQWIVKIRDPGNMKRWLFSMGFLLGYTPKDMPEARSLHGSTINVFTMPALPFCLQKESRANLDLALTYTHVKHPFDQQPWTENECEWKGWRDKSIISQKLKQKKQRHSWRWRQHR